MAAGIPLEKAQKYLKEFNELLVENRTIDPFTERARRAELSANPTALTNIALSFLDAVSGKSEDALKYPRLSLEVNDVNLARHYHHILLHTFSYNELRSVSYELAKKYPSKQFSHNAMSWAYRYGEREDLEFYYDEHIKLLSEAEGRSNAMKHKEELLSEMDNIFDASKCSKSQFQILASIIWSVLSEYKAATGFVELSGRGTGCYIVDIKNLDPKSIARMNFELADRVCADERLDDCALIARFSSPRQLHTGVSYNAGV
ncbi:hypothetical protein [Lelliottia nimipressuralis]|uniref:Uncharacterized protein n=1 Tax=Lelliottia nimipressuralis TaxID=69220 RepID=A0ABD4KC70_9ENTR|nr:hypothetical protein [Lelliottia nimipressuralis]MBF4179120.1 hypothetical protein [Lelliottia nimipressuralis]